MTPPDQPPPSHERNSANSSNYYDMRLLNEVTERPHATQRDLSRRIGAALGLTNLMLRRLAKKGFIKFTHVQKSRIRYLITPTGIAEKARLTCEYIEYSLLFYKHVRIFLQHRLGELARQGQRRILLCGTGELAEIAFLTMQEVGLELIGVLDDEPVQKRFLGHTVRSLGYAALVDCDWVIVTSTKASFDVQAKLVKLGLSEGKILVIPKKPVPLPEPAAEDKELDSVKLEEEAVH